MRGAFCVFQLQLQLSACLLPTETTSTSKNSIVTSSSAVSMAGEPLFSPAQQQCIQKMIAAQTAQKNKTMATKTISSMALASVVFTAAVPPTTVASTSGNIGEYS